MKPIYFLLLACLICVGCTEDKGAGDLAVEDGEHTGSVSSQSDASQQAACLMSLASNHIHEQQYQKALTDIDAALVLVPKHTEYRFLHCLVKERLGEPLPLAEACYAQIVSELFDAGECKENMNCVIADLMAGGADAESRKKQFLALPASAEELELRHHVLDGFDRDEYLNTVLP